MNAVHKRPEPKPPRHAVAFAAERRHGQRFITSARLEDRPLGRRMGRDREVDDPPTRSSLVAWRPDRSRSRAPCSAAALHCNPIDGTCPERQPGMPHAMRSQNTHNPGSPGQIRTLIHVAMLLSDTQRESFVKSSASFCLGESFELSPARARALAANGGHSRLDMSRACDGFFVWRHR